MIRVLKLSGFFVAGLLVSLCLGCGGGGEELDIAPAKGTVKLDGSPLPNVLVTFYPEGKGVPATGTTDENGQFTLTTKEPGDGAMVGKHQIAIREALPEPSENITSADAYAPPDPKTSQSKIPPAFARADQSGLTEEVKSSGDNDFLFDLKSK